jgi:hypothetical protein
MLLTLNGHYGIQNCNLKVLYSEKENDLIQVLFKTAINKEDLSVVTMTIQISIKKTKRFKTILVHR